MECHILYRSVMNDVNGVSNHIQVCNELKVMYVHVSNELCKWSVSHQIQVLMNYVIGMCHIMCRSLMKYVNWVSCMYRFSKNYVNGVSHHIQVSNELCKWSVSHHVQVSNEYVNGVCHIMYRSLMKYVNLVSCMYRSPMNYVNGVSHHKKVSNELCKWSV